MYLPIERQIFTTRILLSSGYRELSIIHQVEHTIDGLHGAPKRQETLTRSEGRTDSPQRSPLLNTPRPSSPSKERVIPRSTSNEKVRPRSSSNERVRPRSPSNERERPETDEHYDPEKILSRSIKKDKSLEQVSKGNPRDPRKKETPERHRSRSSFSDRNLQNGGMFNKDEERKNSQDRNVKSPLNRRDESLVRNPPERQKRPRTPLQEPGERPPSPDSIRGRPVSPDRNMARRTPPGSPQRRQSTNSNERQGRPRQAFSPLVTRYPSPQPDRIPGPARPRTPLSPGKVYTDTQESSEENGVFIDKFGEEKHWTRWTYGEPNIKRAKLADSPQKEDDKLAGARRVTVTVGRTSSVSPKRVRRASSSSEEGVIH